MHSLKTKLRLEPLDGRVLPDATPLAPPAGDVPPQESSEATGQTSAVLDFGNVSSANSYTMVIRIRNGINPGLVTLPTITIGANASPTAVAAAVVAAIENHGGPVSAVQNGTTVTITGPNGCLVDFSTSNGPNAPQLSTTQPGITIKWNGKQLGVQMVF
jgi:hypothetical protein